MPAKLSASIDRALRKAGRPHRAGTVDGHSDSGLVVLGVVVPDIRAIVKQLHRDTRELDPGAIAMLASELAHVGTLEARQVGYELLGRRRDARATLGVRAVEALGRGNDNWKSVDTFSCEVVGPCWREGSVSDAAVARWARSKDRWWRRTALVATVPLNMKSRGGTGDVARTLAVAELCVDDRDDMVVKAMSWALRELGAWDPAAVLGFLDKHGERVAARVRREVTRKLETGRKNR